MVERRNWTADEVRHALALYLRTSFGRFHNRNPDIIKLASRLNRTANAVALKLSNLAALDTSLPQKGMANTSAMDRRIWAEFQSDPNAILDAFQQQTTQNSSPGMAEAAADFNFPNSVMRRVETNQRIGQDFLRRVILASYRERCALTGIEDKRLLNASHIVAWKDDPKNRVNPSNGICLNALHDHAFDRHLITFDEDYCLKVSPILPPIAQRELLRVESQRLELPARFLPDQTFLEKHRRAFFSVSKNAN
ncbi:MAG: HNH endonuclease [Paracoccaceae bacterium]